MIPGLGRSPGEGNGNHSSILAWKISWTEEPGGLQSMGCKELDLTERLKIQHMCGQMFSLLLSICLGVKVPMWLLNVKFFFFLKYCFPKELHDFIVLVAMYESQFLHILNKTCLYTLSFLFQPS